MNCYLLVSEASTTIVGHGVTFTKYYCCTACTDTRKPNQQQQQSNSSLQSSSPGMSPQAIMLCSVQRMLAFCAVRPRPHCINIDSSILNFSVDLSFLVRAKFHDAGCALISIHDSHLIPSVEVTRTGTAPVHCCIGQQHRTMLPDWCDLVPPWTTMHQTRPMNKGLAVLWNTPLMLQPGSSSQQIQQEARSAQRRRLTRRDYCCAL